MFRNTFAALGRATTRMNRMFAGPVMNAEKTGARRTLADGAKQIEERYAKSLSIMHWAIAGGFVACIATVRDCIPAHAALACHPGPVPTFCS